MKNGTLKPHPIAEIFPMLDATDCKALAEDIRDNGLQSEIVIYEEKILDGRNRYDACLLVGVTPKTRVYEGSDPLGYVLSTNLHRRHLTTSQRAAVAAKIANLKIGSNQHKNGEEKEGGQKCPPSKTTESLANSMENSAKALNVSRRIVVEAKQVAREAPEKFKEVVNGTKTVGKAVAEIRKEHEKLKPEEGITDELGTVIPPDCLHNWERGQEVGEILSMVRSLKLKVTALEKSDDPLWARVSWQDVQVQLKRVAYDLSVAMPYAVCPMCQGRTKIKCTMCKSFGLLSKFHYQAVPSELRKDK